MKEALLIVGASVLGVGAAAWLLLRKPNFEASLSPLMGPTPAPPPAPILIGDEVEFVSAGLPIEVKAKGIPAGAYVETMFMNVTGLSSGGPNTPPGFPSWHQVIVGDIIGYGFAYADGRGGGSVSSTTPYDYNVSIEDFRVRGVVRNGVRIR